MSTAGKVLTVLCLLMVLPCVWLIAQTSQLYRNYGKAIDAQEQQVATTVQEFEKAKVDAFATAEKVKKERLLTDAQVVAVRKDLEDLRGLLSRAQETLLRVELQLEAEQQTIQIAQAGKERRDREYAQLEQDQENIIAEVQQLADENDQLLERLADLREEFQMLLAENRDLLRRRDPGNSSDNGEATDTNANASASALFLR
ncbi:hypothetical protein BH23PLA1_BH23PLA1_36380 [soil metagenome]